MARANDSTAHVLIHHVGLFCETGPQDAVGEELLCFCDPIFQKSGMLRQIIEFVLPRVSLSIEHRRNIRPGHVV